MNTQYVCLREEAWNGLRVTVDSLESPGIAVTVRLEVFWSQYGSGLEHLHEHHVTHHPEQTCTHNKTFTIRQEIRHGWKTQMPSFAHSSVFTVTTV